MRALALFLGVVLCHASTSAQEALAHEPERFVGVDGTHFTLDGAPFRFVGANVAVMHGPVHRGAMEATLDAVVEDDLGVVRLWALGEYDDGSPSWADAYAFRRGPSGWLDAALAHLDATLDACRARDLRAIVVLGNRWADYGGLGAYLRWALVPFAADASGAIARSDLSRFYASEPARALYREHVTRVVGRTSSTTGRAYRDDPTILAWELVNELEAPRRDAPVLVRWVEEEAAFVRSLDARHLVSAGHVGYATSSDRRTWREVAGADGIDFVDTHAYPTRYGEVTTLPDLARWIDDRAQLAHHVIHRPLVFGEVGFSATTARVHGVARRRWLDAFLRDAARDGVAGALAWIYVPDGDRPLEHAILSTGGDVARTHDLRAVLGRHARRWARTPPTERNTRLGEDVGETPLWDPRRTILGGGGVHDGWDTETPVPTLRITPSAFDRARFERAGVTTNAPVSHVWASGSGWVRYRFRAPRGRLPLTTLVVSMRASSELPGPGLGATPEDVSIVHVSLDGLPAGDLEVPPDDGLGRIVRMEVDDPAILAAVSARVTHVLELSIDDDALGVCLYGEAGVGDLAPEIGAELPGVITLEWRSTP